MQVHFLSLCCKVWPMLTFQIRAGGRRPSSQIWVMAIIYTQCAELIIWFSLVTWVWAKECCGPQACHLQEVEERAAPASAMNALWVHSDTRFLWHKANSGSCKSLFCRVTGWTQAWDPGPKVSTFATQKAVFWRTIIDLHRIRREACRDWDD